MDILVFTVNADRYALAARDVYQVFRCVAITALPGAPSVVEGVIDVRGNMVPVLDVRLRFGHPHKAPALTDLIIIASSGSRRVAVRADEKASLQKIDPLALEKADESLTRSRYVAGLATLPDGIVVIHDLARFLSEAESESLTQALADQKALRVS